MKTTSRKYLLKLSTIFLQYGIVAFVASKLAINFNLSFPIFVEKISIGIVALGVLLHYIVNNHIISTYGYVKVRIISGKLTNGYKDMTFPVNAVPNNGDYIDIVDTKDNSRGTIKITRKRYQVVKGEVCSIHYETLV